MDLYNQDKQAISNDNMRTSAREELNRQVSAHNQDIANQITSLSVQKKSEQDQHQLDTLAQGAITGLKFPKSVEAYKRWKVARQAGLTSATNPSEGIVKNMKNTIISARTAITSPLQTLQKVQASSPESTATGANTTAIVSPRAELGVNKSALSIQGEVNKPGGLAQKGMEPLIGKQNAGKIFKDTPIDGEEGADKIFRRGNALIGGVQGGMELAKDIKAGHLTGDNWEEKLGDVANVAGSLLDVMGMSYAPAELLGATVHLAGAGLGEIGNLVDKAKQTPQTLQAQIQTAQQGSYTPPPMPAATPIVTARTN
jgi:hypothetical protein